MIFLADKYTKLFKRINTRNLLKKIRKMLGFNLKKCIIFVK